jgi:HlyD family secretion protein
MAKSKRSGGLLVFLIVVVALAIGGWYWLSHRATKPPIYTTVLVTRGELTQAVTATGTLQAVTTVDVSSQISGNIAKLYVDWNSPVKKGQLLAELDPSTYKTAVLQSEGQLANARANYALMKANADRSQELFGKNLIPQSDLDTANAQLAQAAAQVQIQTAVAETAKVNLSRCSIYSPIDGVVISRNVDVGNTVAVSLSAPTLFQIANDLKSMQIMASVAEADIGSVSEGQAANFTVDAYPDRKFRGRVVQIRSAPVTVQNVVTYNTMIDVRNDDLDLKPGMTANVAIVIAARHDALRVPNSALRARIPEELLPPSPTPVAAAATPGAPAPKPLSRAERRAQLHQLMLDAGFAPGTRPSPEVIAKMRALAQQRGIELPALADRSGKAGAPTVHKLYRLVGKDPKTARIEAVSAKLGISDGISTEVIEGLNEGDRVITSATLPGAAPATNPFGGGGRRRF